MLNKKTMGKKGYSAVIFVTLLCFWALLALLSYYFDVELSKTSLSDLNPPSVDETDKGFVESLFDIGSDIPILNAFIPLLKMLTFQYVDVPPAITIMLDVIAILSAFVIVSTLFHR